MIRRNNFETVGARAAAGLVATVMALTIAGCGSSDSTDESATTAAEAPSAEAVDVSAIEWSLDLSATPDESTKTVTFTNDGTEPHVLVFAKLNEGYTAEEAIKLQGKKGSAEDIGSTKLVQPGLSETIDVTKPLGPGNYVMLCPLSGPDGPHYELGQLQEFEITG